MSIWQKQIEELSFPTLEGNTDVDVLIVGGGIAGIMIAYELTLRGVQCIVVESGKICSGVTKNTTAKLTVGHGLLYDSLIKKYGKENAGRYLGIQTEALDKLKALAAGCDCDYKGAPSYVYSLNDRAAIEVEVLALNSLGFDAGYRETPELPFGTVGAVCIEGQGQFNPLKFLSHIANGLKIYENTKVLEFGPNTALTNRGVIKCRKMIIATHFPIINKHGLFFVKMYQHRSYSLALTGAGQISGMYVSDKDTGLSFRQHGEYLLLGGGGHRTGKSGGSYQELLKCQEQYYKDSSVADMWGAQDCITLDGMPYIGRYSNSTPDLYVATGFNKWGMTSSMVSALLLADLITDRKNECEALLSPSRSILHPRLATNLFETALSMITPTVPRCPHLGCALKYNKAEHSWDCPCHGSRFGEDGRLITGPATDGKKLI